MGCDIHMVVEKKHDGEWVGIHEFPYITTRTTNEVERYRAARDKDQTSEEILGQFYELNSSTPSYPARRRNYELFAALAGVRGDGPEPKGIPDDISPLAHMVLNRWDGDAHSHTWYTLREAAVIFMAHVEGAKVVEPGLIYGAANLLGCNIDEDEDADNHRIIIFFDN